MRPARLAVDLCQWCEVEPVDHPGGIIGPRCRAQQEEIARPADAAIDRLAEQVPRGAWVMTPDPPPTPEMAPRLPLAVREAIIIRALGVSWGLQAPGPAGISHRRQLGRLRNTEARRRRQGLPGGRYTPPARVIDAA